MTAIRSRAGDGRSIGALTRDDVIDALQEYARRFGPDDLTAAAFSPSSAKWGGRMDLRDRYYETAREDGRKWPSLNAIKKLFDGSFNAAREAAGFAANSPGPSKRRRPAGMAAPIRDVREHTVFVPSERAREATRRAENAEARLATAQRRIEQLRAELAEANSRPPVVREVRVRPETITKTKTITRTVTVPDERQLERVRSQLADVEAGRRAEAEQARAAVRDRDRALRELESVRAETARAAAEVAKLSRRSEAAVAAAEARAAQVERELAEQGAAITGELRKLSPAELAALRQAGPAGPAVLAAALKRLGPARARNHDLAAALTAIAQAAVTWRDRL